MKNIEAWAKRLKHDRKYERRRWPYLIADFSVG